MLLMCYIFSLMIEGSALQVQSALAWSNRQSPSVLVSSRRTALREREPTTSEQAEIAKLEKDRLDSYLEKKIRPWEGSLDILERRKQVPSEEFTKSTDVVNVIMAAFGEMDCPQLDHGAAVALSFASPAGTIANSGLDPSGYGSFLRVSQSSLLDWRKWSIVKTTRSEEPPSQGDQAIRETIRVNVKGWGSIIGGMDGNDDEGVFDFLMVREGDLDLGGLWLLDVILRCDND